mmetsp:Transcript_43078/g.105323  ORF Transcript_43078/g.105323 Transcript_43078/m.105323 type:complete len:119 (+) Transcript_43078:95-451(+)
MGDLFDMLVTPPERGGTVVKTEKSWDLAFVGREVKRDVLQKRFWLKKALLSELRAGRPYSMRDALQIKIGTLTHQFLSVRGAGKRSSRKLLLRQGSVVKAAKKPKHKVEESDDDESDC